MEKRIVFEQHSLLFCMLAKQPWKLASSILDIPWECSVSSFLGVQYLSSSLLYVHSSGSMHSDRLLTNDGSEMSGMMKRILCASSTYG